MLGDREWCLGGNCFRNTHLNSVPDALTSVCVTLPRLFGGTGLVVISGPDLNQKLIPPGHAQGWKCLSNSVPSDWFWHDVYFGSGFWREGGVIGIFISGSMALSHPASSMNLQLRQTRQFQCQTLIRMTGIRIIYFIKKKKLVKL